MTVYLWEWFVLGAVVLALILFDLFGHVRKAHEPTIKEAAIWSCIYISLAVAFGISLLVRHGSRFATEYFAGYITEYSLSLDNIFVFIIIIAAFKVPRIYQQKVLMYGIVIALALRFVFILLGAALVERYIWVFFIFGAWMLYTAIKQIIDGVQEIRERDSNHELSEEYEPNFTTRLISKYVPTTDGYVGDRLITRHAGKTMITPLLLCIVSIGSVDLMFALDSIPAIYGLTKEPFIVFAANSFALLGLRQMFFLIDGLLEKLIYLHFGLAAILGFIALKLVLHASHGYGYLEAIPEPSIIFSVAFIIVAILITVIVSVLGAKRIEARSSNTAE
ncbi:TerC/Alx family metal homeostasis membrane protein [Arcanobacterium bovis]|uniref:TerC/Alx family metal homeostasis membrane protein n=1 Tax=Arcanobacterium bovis TaxID=2529275 RepID=A0A4Q9V1N0_9ACTO|nr:TerC/Alx family metal homeostasis membrane protein [Arcanobacterium bovis]TBW22953.1 TerC/Alx family metal homeostasis membrane protein [Arcanobacterium bovis]